MSIETADSTTRGGVEASVAGLVDLGLRAPRFDGPPPGRFSSALVGPYLSAFRGGGIEFDEVRGYQAGDDVRSIDWRVTARTGRPHSRVFREERERPLWLFVDLGAAMHFGTHRAFKSVTAAETAALISRWGLDAGDRVGGFVRDPGGASVHPPRRGERAYLGFLDAVAKGTAMEAREDASSFDATLAPLAATVRRGSRVVVVSDFADLTEEGKHHLSDLAGRCDLTLVLVYDVLEAVAPPPGEYRVSDGAEVQTIRIPGGDARDHYRQSFEARVEELKRYCRAHRTELVAIGTHRDPVEVLPAALHLGHGRLCR
jgi:uncharacterized protein (DUF58 family)